MTKTKSKLTERPVLEVQHREIVGKRPVRRLRQEGLVPGVIYGRDTTPISVTVNHRELARLLHSKSGEHMLVTLRLQGDAAWEKPALVKSLQHDLLDGHVVHVDFHAIVLTERIRVGVAIVLKGEPVGVKQDGGILEHFLREIEVECLPTEIPANIEVDIAPLKIGDAIHVRDLAVPANTKMLTDPAGVIASIQAPKIEKPAEETAATTEPEVIREKKEEPAAAGEDAKGGSAEPKKDAKS